MRLLPRLVIVFAVCFMALALLPLPAQAQNLCRYPEIRLSARSGVPGDVLTVYGWEFQPADYVDIYYDGTKMGDRLTDSAGAFDITFTVPESSTGDHRVRAVAIDENIEREARFAVRPGLTISPEQGPAGTNVTVQGRGFAEYETRIEVRYYPNGIYETVADNIEADVRGSWEASFQVPPSTRGEYTIAALGAVNVLVRAVKPAIFEVRPGIRVDEPSGSVGQRIAVSGSGFTPNERGIRILFAGEEVVTGVLADDRGYWEESFELPGLPEGEYSLTAEGDRTRKEEIEALTFQIRPAIVLSPGQGHVGMNVTVSGRGFPAGEDLIILYDGSQVVTATANAQGSFFDVTFSVPQSRHGERVVVAEHGSANHATAIFIVESVAPERPELLSPRDGRRVGFFGKVRPTFKWLEVLDDSGVYYSLQVATSANFTQDSVIASVTGLTGTSYTLPGTEALSAGKYYWRVQAVDGAENQSGWTEVNSFRAGRLPLWAFIVIIVVIVLLLGLRAYFVLLKPRFYE